jgi:hypothetical protein
MDRETESRGERTIGTRHGGTRRVGPPGTKMGGSTRVYLQRLPLLKSGGRLEDQRTHIKPALFQYRSCATHSGEQVFSVHTSCISLSKTQYCHHTSAQLSFLDRMPGCTQISNFRAVMSISRSALDPHILSGPVQRRRNRKLTIYHSRPPRRPRCHVSVTLCEKGQERRSG